MAQILYTYKDGVYATSQTSATAAVPFVSASSMTALVMRPPCGTK